MKKITILLIGLIITGFTETRAQKNAYEEGQLQINAGFSLGLFGYSYGGFYGGYSVGFPAVTANVEYGLSEYFSAGVYGGYFSRTYSYSRNLVIGSGTGDYKDRFTVTSFGARGTFHATEWLNEIIPPSDIDAEKWDIYASLLLGIETSTWNYSDYYGQFGNQPPHESYTDVVFGPIVGVRYMFAENFGLYFEGGRGTFGWGTIGASFRF